MQIPFFHVVASPDWLRAVTVILQQHLFSHFKFLICLWTKVW